VEDRKKNADEENVIGEKRDRKKNGQRVSNCIDVNNTSGKLTSRFNFVLFTKF